MKIKCHTHENEKGIACLKCKKEGGTIFHISYLNDDGDIVQTNRICSKCISHDEVWEVL